MENDFRPETEIYKEVDKIHNEIQPALYEYNPKSKVIFEEKEEDFLIRKILEMETRIKEQYPQRSSHIIENLSELLADISPAEKKERLQIYYNSLNSDVIRHIQSHSGMS